MPERSETLLEFPCRVPIKAMAKAGEGFDSLVVRLVRRHAPDLSEDAFTLRKSRGGKWVSVTFVIEATSQQQIDAIY